MANETKEAIKQLLNTIKSFQDNKDSSQDKHTQSLFDQVKNDLGNNEFRILNLLRAIAGEIPENRLRNGKYKGKPADSVEAASERLNDRLEDLTGLVQLTSDYDNNLIDFLVDLSKRVSKVERFKGSENPTPQTPGLVGVVDIDRVGDSLRFTRSDNTKEMINLSDLRNDISIEALTDSEVEDLFN